MALFPGWIVNNASQALIDEEITHYKTIIISHKVFIQFFDPPQPDPAGFILLDYFNTGGELQDLSAKDLGYLILGPGHICAVC